MDYLYIYAQLLLFWGRKIVWQWLLLFNDFDGHALFTFNFLINFLNDDKNLAVILCV